MTWDSTKNSSVLLQPSFIYAVKPLTSFVRYPFRMAATSCCPSVAFLGFLCYLLWRVSHCVYLVISSRSWPTVCSSIRLFIVEEWSNICKDMLPRLVSSSLSLVQKQTPIFTELPDGAQLLKSWTECGRGLVRGARSVCAFVRICWGKGRKYSIWILDLKAVIWTVRLLNASQINSSKIGVD